MPLRSTCAETWRGADNSRCTWEPFPESSGAQVPHRLSRGSSRKKKARGVFFLRTSGTHRPARSPAVAQRRGGLDDGQEGQGRRGDGQKAGRAIFVSCAHAVRTTRPRPRAACAHIKRAPGPRTCAGPCPHRRRALWRVPALCWRAPVVTCAHALRQLCAHAPTPRGASPWTPQKGKKSRESESGSADSDSADLAADREVDTATLEAQVARLRQLVVRARAAVLSSCLGVALVLACTPSKRQRPAHAAQRASATRMHSQSSC